MSPSEAYLEKAIGKIQERGGIPEADFTQHQLENGHTISTQERAVKDVRIFSHHIAPTADFEQCQVQAPATFIPTAEQFFSAEHPTKPDVAFLKDHFYHEGRISDEHALYILEKATDLLKQEPNLLSVGSPVTSDSHVSHQPRCI
jgi:serine/threonine-protein phosphatase 2B catalytic subunit